MGAPFRGFGAVALLALTVMLALPAGAQAKTRGCHSSSSGSLLGAATETSPASLTGTVEASVLAQYGVLRRAAKPSDSLPPVNSAASDIEFSLSGYFESAIREVGAKPNGERVFIIPGLPRALELPPLRCVPKQVRKSLQKLKERESRRATEAAFCVVDLGAPRSFGPDTCETFSEVPKSLRLFRLPLTARPVLLLVPDGVAAVRVTGPGSASQTIAVSENAYFYEMTPSIVKRRDRLFRELLEVEPKKHPSAAERRHARRVERTVVGELRKTAPGKVEWLGPTGAVVRTVSPPKSDSLLSLVVL